MTPSIKPIAADFHFGPEKPAGKWHYIQLRRQGNYAIYEQSKIGHATGALVKAFEVIRIRIEKPNPWGDQSFDLVEAYPASEAWGVDGWTYRTEQEAMSKLEQLCKTKDNPQ